MKNLHPIRLDRLKDLQFVEFVKSTLRIASEHQAALGLENLLVGYQKAKDLLEEGFKKQKTVLHTKKVLELDAERDRIFMAMLYEVKGFLYHDTDAKNHEAAEKVFAVFKLYGVGKVATLDFNAESAAITHLLRDLKTRAAAETALLKLTEKLASLEKAQADFEKTYAQRGDLVAENKALFEFKQARSFASSVFATLRKQISILPLSFPDKTKEIQGLIDRLDAEIVKYSALIQKNKEEDKSKVESF